MSPLRFRSGRGRSWQPVLCDLVCEQNDGLVASAPVKAGAETRLAGRESNPYWFGGDFNRMDRRSGLSLRYAYETA